MLFKTFNSLQGNTFPCICDFNGHICPLLWLLFPFVHAILQRSLLSFPQFWYRFLLDIRHGKIFLKPSKSGDFAWAAAFPSVIGENSMVMVPH
jgi:hypothetical protein